MQYFSFNVFIQILCLRLMGRGQIGVIDESFEKEVWYMGGVPAVYLTVDVWHPDLTEQRRKKLR